MTLLNFVCKCRAPLPAARAPRAQTKRAKENFRSGAACARKNRDCEEVPIKYGFLLHRAARRFIAHARKARRSHAVSHVRQRARRRIHHAKKNLRRTAPQARLTAPARQKTRESVATDSHRKRAPRPYEVSFGVGTLAFFTAARRRAASMRRLRRVRRGGTCRAQIPMRFLRRSLTACGLALPPDAFIT